MLAQFLQPISSRELICYQAALIFINKTAGGTIINKCKSGGDCRMEEDHGRSGGTLSDSDIDKKGQFEMGHHQDIKRKRNKMMWAFTSCTLCFVCCT